MKKILKICLVINLFLLTFQSMTFGESNYCELAPVNIDKRIRVNDFPSYFFKVHPSGKYIGFIGLNGNRLLELDTGKTLPLPGYIDPTFSPKGEFLLTPISKGGLEGVLSFKERINHRSRMENNSDSYKLMMGFYQFNQFEKELNKGKVDKDNLNKLISKPIFLDNESSGVYQSSSFTTAGDLRVVTDENGLSAREYKVNSSTNTIKTNGKLKSLCENIEDMPTDLPILSKDGKFLSVFNSNQNTTQIYNLEEKNNCSLALDLGIATGKVAFNKDSSQISFHVDHFKDEHGNYFSGVSGDIMKDVYVMNLEEVPDQDKQRKLVIKNWGKASNNSVVGNGSYYPDFDSNGNIFYLSDVNNKFEFVKVKPTSIHYVPYTDSLSTKLSSDAEEKNCFKYNDNNMPLFILGNIWAKACLKLNSVSVSDSIFLSLKIPKENCQEIITKNWTQEYIENLKESDESQLFDLGFLNQVKLADLLAACPEDSSTHGTNKIVGEWKKNQEKNIHQLVQQKCIRCHTQEISYKKEVNSKEFYDENGKLVEEIKIIKDKTLPSLNSRNIDAKLANKILAAITHKDKDVRMPRNSTLDEDEFELFRKLAISKNLELSVGEYIPNEDQAITGSKYSIEALNELLKIYKADLSEHNYSKEEEQTKVNSYKKRIWCEYGQLGCVSYIQKEVDEVGIRLLAESPNLTADELNKSLEKTRLELMCNIGFGNITYSECYDE